MWRRREGREREGGREEIQRVIMKEVRDEEGDKRK